jgi:AAA+ ATPase superfamily predicted ATPase
MKGSSQFVGRKRELAALGDDLERVRATGDGCFAWIYGRRRVGKSRLIEAFVERSGAACLFFQAPRRPHPDALDRFVRAIEDSTLPAAEIVRGGARAETWTAALEIASRELTPDRPGVIVIDELPYLIELDQGIAADIQQAWDRLLSRRAVMLVCVGSDMRMMRALTQYPAELFGRPTREMRITPFTPRDIGALTRVGAPEAFDRFLIVGGFPQLARSWPPDMSRRVYLEQTLCDPASPLVVDGLRILEAELPRELQARDVLEAIGHGERTFSNISADSGVSNNSSLNNALKTLQRKSVIDVEVPIPTRSRPSRRYVVADPYLRFWLRFVGPSLDEIDRGRSDLVHARIERDWSTYRGMAVEPIVRRSIERLLPDRRFGQARYVGGYWTRSGSVEVDLVGASDPQVPEVSFVGSIKWREGRPFGRRDAQQLAADRYQVPGAEDAMLVGVSRSGFEAQVGLDVSLSADELLLAWPDP